MIYDILHIQRPFQYLLDLLLTVRESKPRYSLHTGLVYSRYISLRGSVIYGRLLYIYIQTCINICFVIQNGWENGNIIRFLCLSNLDLSLQAYVIIYFMNGEAQMRTMLFLGLLVVLRNVDADPAQHCVRPTGEVVA